MKIEITHDSLANTIYQKASEDDIMRLKIANFIHARMHFYKDSNKLLDSDDLSFIKPFVKQIVLTKEERNFIKESENKVKLQNQITWASVVVIIFVLLWLVYSNYSAWLVSTAANQALEKEHTYIQVAKDSIQKLLDKEYLLKQKVDSKDRLLNRTNAELQELVMQRESLILQLEEKNKELEAAYRKIKGEKIKLSKDKTQLASALQSKIKEQKMIKLKLSNQQKSLALSRKAQLLISSKSRPSEKEIKEAFLLSSAAWNLYHDNSQAMDVLNEIKIKTQKTSNSGSFLANTRPKYTYTHRKIESLIGKLAPKYGKLSKSQISKRLK